MWGCTYDSLAGKKFFTQGNSRKGGEDKKEKHIAQIVQMEKNPFVVTQRKMYGQTPPSTQT